MRLGVLALLYFAAVQAASSRVRSTQPASGQLGSLEPGQESGRQPQLYPRPATSIVQALAAPERWTRPPARLLDVVAIAITPRHWGTQTLPSLTCKTHFGVS